MDMHHLVRMANQIGEFFQVMPDHAEALEGIANHIRKFWAPRMRLQLGEHLAEHDGEGLLPIVKEALAGSYGALPGLGAQVLKPNGK